MSLDKNKALAKRAILVWATGNLEEIDELYAPHCVIHQHYLRDSSQTLKGAKEWKKFVKEHRQASPDIHDIIEDQIAEGDKVVTRITCIGTHQGPFMKMKPTHKKFTFTGIVIHRIENGKIIETWANWDKHGALQQLDLNSPVLQRKSSPKV